MPDFSMCQNTDCSNRQKCYRFMAVPDTWQWYTDFSPGDKGGCADFMVIGGRKIQSFLPGKFGKTLDTEPPMTE